MVPASSLSFTVLVYTVTAVLCFLILAVRRNVGVLGRAELGGPHFSRWISFAAMLMLWLIYLLLSALMAYEVLPKFM